MHSTYHIQSQGLCINSDTWLQQGGYYKNIKKNTNITWQIDDIHHFCSLQAEKVLPYHMQVKLFWFLDTISVQIFGEQFLQTIIPMSYVAHTESLHLQFFFNIKILYASKVDINNCHK